MELGTVTACILTRNSAAEIESCIRSIIGEVCRCLVVDFGSTDATIQLALEAGAEVVPGVWSDDFAAARNYALSLVTTSWVFMLDADEIYEPGEGPRLAERLEEAAGPTVVFGLLCKNVDKDTNQLLGNAIVERIFQPSAYRYEGAIHETLTSLTNRTKRFERLADMSIRHFGYTQSVMPAKSKRNLKLLHAELDRKPKNGKLLRYLANEYFNQDAYVEAAACAEQALAGLQQGESYSRACAYYYLFMSQFQLERCDEAEETAFRCVREFPAYADPYGFLLELCYGQGRWRETLEYYRLWMSSSNDLTHAWPGYLIMYADGFHQRAEEASRRLLEAEESAIPLRALLDYC